MFSSKTIEKLAQALSVITFVLMCWVVHRTLQVRTQCVNSSFISFVQIGTERFENCVFESRLSLGQLTRKVSRENLDQLRALEVMEPLSGLFPVLRPRLAVELNQQNPRFFELGNGYIRLGKEWLNDTHET